MPSPGPAPKTSSKSTSQRAMPLHKKMLAAAAPLASFKRFAAVSTASQRLHQCEADENDSQRCVVFNNLVFAGA